MKRFFPENPPPVANLPEWAYNQFLQVSDNINELAGAWDDLRFPASTGKALTGKEPTLDVDGLLLFAKNATNTVGFVAQLPHSWKEGSTLKPHLHWMKVDAGDTGAVYWRMEYKWAPIGEVMDATWTTVNALDVVAGTPDAGVAEYQMITSFGDIDATGKQVSDSLILLLSRIGADGADLYDDNAKLLEFDIHFYSEGSGSHLEYVK